MSKAPKMGRPRLPKGQVKKSTFSIRLTPDERSSVEVAASATGQSASEWARGVLLLASAKAAESGRF